MEGPGLIAYLSNQLLLQELVDKLPAALKLQWANHQQALPVTTLASFSAWLTPATRAAISVTMSTSLTEPSEAKTKRRPAKAKGQLYLHNAKREEAKVADPHSRQHWEKTLVPLATGVGKF